MEDPRILARALRDHYSLGDIDEAVLVAGVIGISQLALGDGDTDAALAVIASLPDGWEAHVQSGSEPVQEAAQALAQLLLDKGLVNEGIDVSLYGPVAPPGPPS